MYKIVIHYPKNRPSLIQQLNTGLVFVQHRKKNKATATVTQVSTDAIMKLLLSLRQHGVVSCKIKRLRTVEEKLADKEMANA